MAPVDFGTDRPAPSADLARLHLELLPTSPVLGFGEAFLEHFYYRVLPAEGMIFGSVAYDGDEPVGFVVATRSANTFMQTALRRCWRDLAKVLLRHPPTPRTVVNAVGLVRHRHSSTGPDIAEILSLGIRPQNRRRGVGRDLIRHTCERLGDVPVQALVDETNMPSRRMFDELGWSVTSRVTAGWPVPQEVFTRLPS